MHSCRTQSTKYKQSFKKSNKVYKALSFFDLQFLMYFILNIYYDKHDKTYLNTCILSVSFCLQGYVNLSQVMRVYQTSEVY